jgi:hypothetical protein
MKRLLILALTCVALLFGAHTISGVGERHSECLWGTDCSAFPYAVAVLGMNDPSLAAAAMPGGYCLQDDYSATGPNACVAEWPNDYGEFRIPFAGSLFVGTCAVTIADNDTNWETTEKLTLTIQVFNHNAASPALQDMGDTFDILASADSCGSNTNCMDDEGVGLWTVNTSSSSLATAVTDGGTFQIEVSGVNTGTDYESRVWVACAWRPSA